MAKVIQMHTDYWSGGQDYSTIVTNPSLHSIKKAILCLDGKTKTIVVLALDNAQEKFLMVSGCWNERYMVNTTRDNYDFYSLVDKNKTKEAVTVIAGGQEGEYEKRKFVERDKVMAAVEFYFKHGEKDNNLDWESDY